MICLNGGDSVNFINANWERIPGVGIKEVYDVNGVVKAEIIFDYEKEKVMTVSGNLYQLIGFENQEKYADYLSVKEKMAKNLYNNKNW